MYFKFHIAEFLLQIQNKIKLQNKSLAEYFNWPKYFCTTKHV